MNKYKILSYVLIIILLVLTIYHFLTIEFFKLELTNKKFEMMELNCDVGISGEIISKRMFKISEIDTFLINNFYPSDGNYERNGDTIFLNKSYLVFDKDSLIKVEPNSYKEN